MYAGLILAAGQSRRFGSDKRQMLLPNGRTMLDHVLTQYRHEVDRLWVVLPPNDAFGQHLCQQHGAVAVVSPLAAEGMGHSLAAGVRAVWADGLQDTPAPLQGLIIGLADMPGVSQDHVHRLVTALQEQIGIVGDAAMVVPSHQSQIGHPRGLGTRWLNALTRLEGDQGARHVVNWQHAHRVVFDDPGVLLDIDVPTDLIQFN